jgi:hypothetical protein
MVFAILQDAVYLYPTFFMKQAIVNITSSDLTLDERLGGKELD